MKSCPQCRASLPPDASTEGLCPQCLLRQVLDPNTQSANTTLEANSSPFGNPEATEEVVGQTYGPYKIVKVLGEGGMGTVYLAEQLHPIRRLVAMKLIKFGMNSQEVLSRFDSERQALALMNHPNIARVYDAGMSRMGQPFFVMEYVVGLPITEYCDSHKLNNRERMDLFVSVCGAVQHAHQKGIIHRDIKPSNVLVGERDGKPAPMIIDFGIAKAVDSTKRGSAAFTLIGDMLGTPEYMSPEQAALDSSNIDTSTDVYSLGILLYELLVGVLPFDRQYLQQAGIGELLRIIREEDPPAPSAKLAELQAVATEIALDRGTDAATLRRELASDLNWIVMKALEKNRTRRYASASDLAGDVSRYLADQPIEARPPSARYHLEKFARRHRPLVLSASLVSVVLIAGVIAIAWEAVRADRAERAALTDRDRATIAEQSSNRERDRALIAERAANDDKNRAVAAERAAVRDRNRAVAAEQEAVAQTKAEKLAELRAMLAQRASHEEAANTRAVSTFLQDLLSQAMPGTQISPEIPADPNLKVRDVLDRAAGRIPGQFRNQPLVEAALQQTIGNAYRTLGLYDEAQKHLESSLALRKKALGEVAPETLLVMEDIALVSYRFQRQLDRAEALYKSIIEIREHISGPDNPATLGTMERLADLYRYSGRMTEADKLFARVLSGYPRTRGENRPMSALLMNNLGLFYERQGKMTEAESLLGQSFEQQRRQFGADYPETLNTENNLASVKARLEKPEEAITLYREVLERRRRVLGLNHPETSNTISRLSSLYLQLHRYGLAEALWNDVLKEQTKQFGEEHPEPQRTMVSLAWALSAGKQYARAEGILTKVIAARKNTWGLDDLETRNAITALRILYGRMGKLERMEPLIGELLEEQQRKLGVEHSQTLVTMVDLAGIAETLGHLEKAEALLAKVIESRRRLLGSGQSDTVMAMNGLAGLYQREGKFLLSESTFREASAENRRVRGDNDTTTLLLMTGLANVYQQQGKYSEAEVLLEKVLNARVAAGNSGTSVAIAQTSLATLRLDQAKFAEAEALLQPALKSLNVFTPNQWWEFEVVSLLGASLAGQNRYAEAEPLLIRGYDGLVERKVEMGNQNQARLKRASESIVKLYEQWRKPEKALAWKARLGREGDLRVSQR